MSHESEPFPIERYPLVWRLIEPSVEHLHELGIEPEITVDAPVNADQLDAFNSEFNVRLPNELRQIYAETDGFMVHWETGEEVGQLAIPSLYELRLYRQRWVNGEMPNEEWVEHLQADEAQEVLEGMKSWLPFDESGGGDSMCIDCSNGQVVQYDLSWSNPTDRNGTIYANNMFEYIKRYGQVCFLNVWELEHIVRGKECWANWRSAKVPAKYMFDSPDDPFAT